MPVGFSEVTNDWNEKGESIRFVSFKDVKEVIIFEETHGSVGYLEMKAWNALDKALKDFRNVRLEFLNLTSLKHFNKFGNEHDFFGRVGERPILNEAIEQEQAERRILGQEEHGASHEMFMEEVASLNFVEGNDDVFEEDDMLLPERNCKSTDDTGENIQKFRGAIELESFMDQWVKTVIDCLTDHFSSWDKFGIQSVQDVLEVLPFSGLLWVKQL